MPSTRSLAAGARRAAVGGLLIAGTALIAACGGSTSSSADATSGDAAAAKDKKVRVAAFLLATANAYSQANAEGVRAAAKELGNADVQIFDGKFDGAVQLQQVQNAIASGKFNAFVIFPNDSVSVVPAVEQAIAKGIKVTSGFGPIGPKTDIGDQQVKGMTGTAWIPYKNFSEDMGRLTVEACKKDHPDANPCKVAYLWGAKKAAFDQVKYQGFRRIVDASTDPKIEVVAQPEGQFLIDASLQATQDVLQAHPDLDVVMASGDQMSLGAQQAVDKAGKTGKVSILGLGAATQGVKAINAGKWFGSVTLLPQTEGKVAGEMAINAVRGTEPEQFEANVLDGADIGPFYTKEDASSGFLGEWTA